MTSTDPSGLSASTTYYFKVNTVEYSITTGGSPPTYAEVANLMDAEITSAGFRAIIVGTAPSEDIRVYNDDVRGSGSETLLSLGTTGTDLFTSLTGFVDFDDPVLGDALGAIEVIAPIDATGTALSGTAPFTITVGPEVGGLTILSNTVTADVIDITFDFAAAPIIVGGDAGTGIIDYAYTASGSTTFNEVDNVAEYTIEFVREATGSASFNEVDDVAEYTIELTYEGSNGATFAGAADTAQEYEPAIYGTDSYYGDILYES